MDNAAVLFSGGKDSCFALYKEYKNYNIKCLISLKPKTDSSYMFHYPNIKLVKKQARILNLPLIFKKTKGEKEKELKDLEKAVKKAVKKYKIKVLISGALASNYQKSRIENICERYNLKSVTPLWHSNSEEYIKNLIRNKFEVIIVGIAADGLNESFLGRRIGKSLVRDFKKLKIHIGGEGGEYESLVVNCPLFNKKLKIVKSKKQMENEYTGRLIIKKVGLV